MEHIYKIKKSLELFAEDIEEVRQSLDIEFDDSILKEVFRDTIKDTNLLLSRYLISCPSSVNESKILGIFFYHFFFKRPIKNQRKQEIIFWHKYIETLTLSKGVGAITQRKFYASLKFYLQERPITPDSLYIIHTMLLDFICN